MAGRDDVGWRRSSPTPQARSGGDRRRPGSRRLKNPRRTGRTQRLSRSLDRHATSRKLRGAHPAPIRRHNSTPLPPRNASEGSRVRGGPKMTTRGRVSSRCALTRGFERPTHRLTRLRCRRPRGSRPPTGSGDARRGGRARSACAPRSISPSRRRSRAGDPHAQRPPPQGSRHPLRPDGVRMILLDRFGGSRRDGGRRGPGWRRGSGSAATALHRRARDLGTPGRPGLSAPLARGANAVAWATVLSPEALFASR
jgi:hypothetical protein